MVTTRLQSGAVAQKLPSTDNGRAATDHRDGTSSPNSSPAPRKRASKPRPRPSKSTITSSSAPTAHRSRSPGAEGLTIPRRSPSHFGLIQERLPHSSTPGSLPHIYCLIVQSILWNQTRGVMARPVLSTILERYTSPEVLAKADVGDLERILQPIGLFRTRARRLLKLAEVWLEKPPRAGMVYLRKGYPVIGPGSVAAKGKRKRKRKVPGEWEDAEEAVQGWEIAHLPGVGPYALDSFRIFCRDGLRGLTQDEGHDFEPEWQRVVPTDKDLRAFLIWKWKREGWEWNPLTGRRRRMTAAHSRDAGNSSG